MASALAPLSRLVRTATPRLQLEESAQFIAATMPYRLRKIAGALQKLPDRYRNLTNVNQLTARCLEKAPAFDDNSSNFLEWVKQDQDVVVTLEQDIRTGMTKIMGEIALSNSTKPAEGPAEFALQKGIHIAWNTSIRAQTLLRHFIELVHMQLDLQSDAEPAVEEMQLNQHLNAAVNDTLSLVTEKYGVAPQIVTNCDDTINVLCSRGHLRVMLLELLKNASAAMINRYGIDVDLCDPITVCAGRLENEVGIQVVDLGNGILHKDIEKCFKYFHTTVPYSEPTYADGSRFGGELEGRGVGLPMCSAYAQVYGGAVRIASTPGWGTTVVLSLRDDALL